MTRASRTGTTRWRNLRARVLLKAQLDSIEHCPICKTELNYNESLLPSSAEVDHLVPYSLGGKDEQSNCQVICRACNQSKGNKGNPKRMGIQQRKPVKSSRVWENDRINTTGENISLLY